MEILYISTNIYISIKTNKQKIDTFHINKIGQNKKEEVIKKRQLPSCTIDQ
jgi:hypothetical protein